MKQKQTYNMEDRVVSSPYKWDLKRLEKLARAINRADANADFESEKNRNSKYVDNRAGEKGAQSQTCSA